jgi:predicted DNA-binding protein YlxM (UPF0122 family)
MIPQESTPIKNDVLIEVFAKGRLTYNEMRIALFIIRWSWGFDDGERRRDWTKEFTIAEIAKEIGMSRSHCSETIKKMVKENKLLQNGNRFQFNEHFETWIIQDVRKPDTVRNPDTVRKPDASRPESGRSPSGNRTLSVRNPDTPHLQETQLESGLEGKKNHGKENIKESIKETLKKRIYNSRNSKNIQTSINEEEENPPRVPPSPPTTDVKHVLDYWNACNIIKHKDTEKIRKKIRAALKIYTVEELEGAIRNYAYVLSNPQKFFWTHKWQLKDFLDRGVDRFLPSNFREEDYYLRLPKTKAELIREKNDAILAKLYWEAEQKEKNNNLNEEVNHDTERDDTRFKNDF